MVCLKRKPNIIKVLIINNNETKPDKSEVITFATCRKPWSWCDFIIKSKQSTLKYWMETYLSLLCIFRKPTEVTMTPWVLHCLGRDALKCCNCPHGDFVIIGVLVLWKTCKNITARRNNMQGSLQIVRLQYQLYPLQHKSLIHPCWWLTCINTPAWICCKILCWVWPSGIPLYTTIGVKILPEAVIVTTNVTTNVAHLVSRVDLQIWTVCAVSKVNGIGDWSRLVL